MSDDYLVRNCAPTLAGIKPANLFTYPYEEKEAILGSIRRMNQRLRAKGIRIIPLRFSENNVLIYLYRPAKRSADLEDSTAAKLLRQCGYPCNSCGHCVVKLGQKLRAQEDFPHEIGLFLGYPPEDVCGFIENKARNCKCVGCRKVYGDEEAAKKKFAQYRKCTHVYCDQWAKGKDIERLTVAG